MECLQKQPLLNTSVNNVSMNATIQAIDTFIQQKKKSYIVAINADVVMKIEKDTYLKEITDQAARDVVTELVIKPALKKAIQVLNPDVPGTNS